MRTYIAIYLVLMIAFIQGCKKEELHWQKISNIESNTTSRLNRIAVLDNNYLVIAGGEKFLKAEILLSVDGGNSWGNFSFPEAGKGMYGLGIAPNGNIYMSGFDGKVIYSSNNANSWTTGQIPDWKYYVANAYPTNEMGVYVSTLSLNSGTIVRVDNSFGVLDTMGFGFALNDICFPKSNTGYVSGYGAVLKTTDTGKTWTILNIRDDNFKSLYCFDENNIWTCGYNGSILHSTNGGESWDEVRNGNKITQARYRLNDITFKDENHGWAVGENGAILYTDNGGSNWKAYKKFTDTHLLSIAALADGNLIVTGENGAIYKLHI